MAEGSNQETTEMRYLLGILSPDDQVRMEQAFFADDAKFEELEIVEAELVDAYVRKALSPEHQKQFEARLQENPRLKERVTFANLLLDKATTSLAAGEEVESAAYADRQIQSQTKLKWWEVFLAQPAFRFPVAAGVFVILLGGVVLFFQARNLRHQGNELAAERARFQQAKLQQNKQSGEQQTKYEQLAADLQRERDERAADLKLIDELQRTGNLKDTTNRRPSLRTFATIFLTPGSLRSGGTKRELIIGPATTTARAQLALERDDYPAYVVTIKTADGTEVIRKKRLKPLRGGSGPRLVISVPAQRLSPGDYVIHVDGVTTTGEVESVNDYAFRVLKKDKSSLL